ncbi:MAG: hypothetical protein ABI779_04350 [Acidobacteriota bacterium]
MSAGDSISATDRDLMKRLTLVLAFVFIFTAAFSHLSLVYSQKFHDRTASALWIWARHPMSSNQPVAFFAARDLDLPANRVFTRIKLLGDPEYTLFVNGREVAGRLVGQVRTLDVYDVSDLVQTGRNRIVVAVRSPKGVGGLLVAIDLAPEIENWVVSDGRWKIYREWDPLLLQYEVAGHWEAPAIIGAPPVGSWNFMEIARHDRAAPAVKVLAPKSVFLANALLPNIRTISGVAVAGTERTKAMTFDFAFTRGRLRLSIGREGAFSRVVQVRFANDASELGSAEANLRPIVFAPGEVEVTTPEEHDFRYVMAFARDTRAAVVQARVR